MSWLQKTWLFLNNKKTNIGASLLFLALALEKFSDIWLDGLSPDWITKTVESLEWLGALFSGVGLSHKGIKKITEPMENPVSAEPQ